MFIYHKLAIALLGLTLVSKSASAQTWSIGRGAMDMQFGAIVYIETTYAKVPGGADTLNGTGFLLSSHGKMYLVTAKHLVTAQLTGKDRQEANNAIFVSHSAPGVKTGFTIKGLSATPNHIAYVFSTDQDDIAIISLQKSPLVKAGILKQEAKSIPVDSIDKDNDRYPDESFFHATYTVYKNKKGEQERSSGIRPGKIKTFDDKQHLYIIEDYTAHACAGSPLFIGGKIIGMVLGETGVTSNADIVKDQYNHTNTGVVVKASLIIPLLRRLQVMEKASLTPLIKTSIKGRK